ncbi:hypothetical protein ZIOFF_028833 [Zingiber officinale]|uniref:Uncharacterized protein n=1 Tax=Zingiber officinale TaxID=94328 RepID=A0A8J5H794_ZINOF|nr:hypothetical protein ZIOFF_028833 [Zingiber officinale]
MERSKWKKVAYGGMQPGYDDNYTDESFLEEMVMNANVVKRDMPKVMLDSVSITQYVCIVSLVVSVWAHTLSLHIDEDIALLALGFSVLLLTARQLSIQLLLHYLLNISFFISGLYVICDASGVRLHAGKQAEVLNQLLYALPEGHPLYDYRPLRKLLGHTPFQWVRYWAVL